MIREGLMRCFAYNVEKIDATEFNEGPGLEKAVSYIARSVLFSALIRESAFFMS